MKPNLPLLGLAALTGISLAATDVEAQEKTFGVTSHGALTVPAEVFGVDNLYGFGGRLLIQPRPHLSFGFGADYFRGALQPPTPRDFRLIAPAVEANLYVGSPDLFASLSVSPQLGIYQMSATASRDASTVLVPSIGGTAGISVGVVHTLNFDLGVGAALSYDRPGILTETSLATDAREWNVSPVLKAGLSFRLKSRDRVARFDDLPVSGTGMYRPVRAQPAGPAAPRNPDELKTVDPNAIPATTEGTLLGSVYFGDGSFDVEPRYDEVLSLLVDYLRSNPEVRLRLKGFTSTSGSPRQNLSLAERRANAVRYHLVYFYGIAEDRVEAQTGGVDNAAQPDLARRVEAWTLVR